MNTRSSSWEYSFMCVKTTLSIFKKSNNTHPFARYCKKAKVTLQIQQKKQPNMINYSIRFSSFHKKVYCEFLPITAFCCNLDFRQHSNIVLSKSLWNVFSYFLIQLKVCLLQQMQLCLTFNLMKMCYTLHQESNIRFK